MMHQQMNQKKTTRREIEYILGHSPDELRRLMLQADVLRPTTERLLREAGLRQGMRVLDLGCGAGDVAMLAADLVGPRGSVVGIDRNAEALALARDRARSAGYANIEFPQAAAEDFPGPAAFDFAVGRYVVIHQAEPARFIRAAASHVKPGGVVAFHEIAIYDDYCSLASVPLWQQAIHWSCMALRSAIAHPDAAGRMMAHFHDAGLAQPVMFSDIPVDGGRSSPFYAWLAMTVRSVLPQLEKTGIATAAEVDIDTLEDRLRDAVSGGNGQALAPPQFCAWSRV
jgi:2-polyprenyl-3-methyl-5-hydroxy-6-metoxy-1,4-benzoquinol methylase